MVKVPKRPVCQHPKWQHDMSSTSRYEVRLERERDYAMIQPNTTTADPRTGDLPAELAAPASAEKTYGDFISLEAFENWLDAELVALETGFLSFQTQRSTCGSLGR